MEVHRRRRRPPINERACRREEISGGSACAFTLAAPWATDDKPQLILGLESWVGPKTHPIRAHVGAGIWQIVADKSFVPRRARPLFLQQPPAAASLAIPTGSRLAAAELSIEARAQPEPGLAASKSEPPGFGSLRRLGSAFPADTWSGGPAGVVTPGSSCLSARSDRRPHAPTQADR